MTAYKYGAPAGIPGDIVTQAGKIVEPAKLIAVSGVYAQKFGIPMTRVSGGVSQWTGTNDEGDFAGILARTAPYTGSPTSADFGSASPNPDYLQDLLTNGFISVVCTVGTPVTGGTVYVRTVADTGKAIGDLEATADDGNNIALLSSQAVWATDGKDADNNATIRVGKGY